ncbi:MAG: chitooligosaccharide deacetylase [Candidatus Saccharibacteria bacterium]|nr:chitooligosaccharide deacetylase [Candidatus Saccharibacteria bacterium]
MKKKATRRSYHVVIGITSVVSAIVIGIGAIELFAYLNYGHHMLSPIVTTQTTQPTLAQPVPLSLAITSIIEPTVPTVPTVPAAPIESPDYHLPPIANGMVPVITSLPTNQPVVFLTIDDGAHKSPDELPTLLDNHIQATLFLARLFINDNPGFFTDFQKAGYQIEDHSLDHLVDLPDIRSYDVQRAQICGMADYDQARYGKRPEFFRAHPVDRTATRCAVQRLTAA